MHPIGPADLRKPPVLPTRWAAEKMVQGKTNCAGQVRGERQKRNCHSFWLAVPLAGTCPCTMECRHRVPRHMPVSVELWEVIGVRWMTASQSAYQYLVICQGTPHNRTAVLRNKGGIWWVLNSSCNCPRNGEIRTARKVNTALQGPTPYTKNSLQKDNSLKECLAGLMPSLPWNFLLFFLQSLTVK